MPTKINQMKGSQTGRDTIIGFGRAVFLQHRMLPIEAEFFIFRTQPCFVVELCAGWIFHSRSLQKYVIFDPTPILSRSRRGRGLRRFFSPGPVEFSLVLVSIGHFPDTNDTSDLQ